MNRSTHASLQSIIFVWNMTLDLYLILGVLLLHPLVNASATPGTSSRQLQREWTGYLSDRSKDAVLEVLPKPRKGITPIERVSYAGSHLWAKKAKNIHAWCLQEMVKGKDGLFRNYAGLMKEWFPNSQLYVYHSPHEGSLQNLEITLFHPVQHFFTFSFLQGTSVMTMFQNGTRGPRSVKIGDYGFAVRNLVNGGRVWKGQPIFLYVRVGRQAWG